MNLLRKLTRWAQRRAKPGLSGPIVIGHAMLETNPESSRFGKKIKRCGKPGTLNKSHIVDVVRDGYRHTYHATKGWRCVKE